MGCPFRKICREKINYKFYSEYCTSSYLCTRCKKYQEISSKKMTPKEWEKYVSGKSWVVLANTTSDYFVDCWTTC